MTTEDSSRLKILQKGWFLQGILPEGIKSSTFFGIIDFVIFIRSPENQEYNVMKYCYRDPIMVNPVVGLAQPFCCHIISLDKK